MAVKKIKCGKRAGMERFVVETMEEDVILEKANNFFPNERVFLTKGLEYVINGRSASAIYNNIKNGISISLKDWERTKAYARRFDDGERYDPENFSRAEPGLIRNILLP
jgi:hypothetical protein